jgi:hypothetical protein
MTDDRIPDDTGKPSSEQNKDPLSNLPNKNFFGYMRHHGLAILCALLMIAGLITSFFFVQIGGILVGLALGLSFFEELFRYFLHMRDFHTAKGLFKTLMMLGGAIYLVLGVPLFLLALLAGFGIRAFVHWKMPEIKK